LKSFFTTGTLASKKIVEWGNSTVSNAGEFFQELATHCGKGDALEGLTCTPETDALVGGGTFPYSIGNIFNFGNNGAKLSELIANTGAHPYPLSAVVTAAPDLLIMRGPLINDVRNGACNLVCSEGLLTTALNTLTSSLPNMQILLTVENSLLASDPGAYGWVTAVATTETLVDGSASGVTSAGSHIVTVASMPDSIYPGPLLVSNVAPAQVIINSGLGDAETVTVTAVSGNTFTANFAILHTNGFSVVATMPTASQAYSAILRQAVLSMKDEYTNVSVLDLQSALYGTVAPQNSALMLNQLHPGPSGRIAEADLIADYLLKVRNGDPAMPTPPGTLLAGMGNYPTGLNIGAMGGSGIIPYGVNGASGSWRGVEAYTNGSVRWLFGADNVSESGSNAGSNWSLNAYSDTGVFLGQYLSINRSTANANFLGSQILLGSNVATSVQVVRNGISGSSRTDDYLTSGFNRWSNGVVSTPESGSNSGSDWTLTAYNDSGSLLGNWISIIRADGSVTFGGRTFSLVGNVINIGGNATTGIIGNNINGAAGNWKGTVSQSAGVNDWLWGEDVSGNYTVRGYPSGVASDYLVINKTTGLTTLLDKLVVGSGGSANHTVCWKADGETLGYCSVVVAADGTCGTCN
jgi:hypothetical protein